MAADGLKTKTLDWYRALLGAFAAEHSTLESVTVKDMRLYIVALRGQDYHLAGTNKVKKEGGLSESTISAHIRALHKFWRWAANEYQIANPMSGVKYPKKPEPKPKAIPMDSVQRLFAATGDDHIGIRNRALLALLIDTGCRAGGLVGLRVEDVDIQQRRAIVLEKGGKTRAVIFTDYTGALIQQWLDVRLPAPTLFYNFETLKPLTTSGLRGILKRLAKRAGVEGKFNPHSFRHLFAREYLKAGGDLATLSKLMGHRDVTTTVHHYAIFTPSEIADKHEQFSPMNQVTKDPTKVGSDET